MKLNLWQIIGVVLLVIAAVLILTRRVSQTDIAPTTQSAPTTQNG